MSAQDAAPPGADAHAPARAGKPPLSVTLRMERWPWATLLIVAAAFGAGVVTGDGLTQRFVALVLLALVALGAMLHAHKPKEVRP